MLWHGLVTVVGVIDTPVWAVTAVLAWAAFTTIAIAGAFLTAFARCLGFCIGLCRIRTCFRRTAAGLSKA